MCKFYWDINVVFVGEYLMLFQRSMLPASPGVLLLMSQCGIISKKT